MGETTQQLERQACRSLLLLNAKFTDKQCANVFQAMLRLIRRGVGLDLITVQDELRRKKQWEPESREFLAGLIRDSACADCGRDKGQQRKLAADCQRCARAKARARRRE